MRTTRIIAVAAGLLLVAIVACAAALAASGGASTPTVDPANLVVGAGPPSTATGVLTYTSGSVSVTATCAFDFAHGRADVVATASISVVSITFEARVLGPVAVANVGAFSSVVGAPWVSIPSPRAPSALDDLAAAMRDPAKVHLHADTTRASRHDGVVTTTYLFRHVTLPSTTGLPITLPHEGHVAAVVTTGAKGQLLAVAAHLWNANQSVHVTFVVTGYDVAVSIPAPSPSDLVPLTAARAHAIFGTSNGAFARLLRGVSGSGR